MNRVEEILNRIYESLSITKDVEFCERYAIKKNTLSTWKKRNSVPYELIEEISQNENISLDYLFTGKEGNKKASNTEDADKAYHIPIAGIVSAGGGQNLHGVEAFEIGEELLMDKALFRTSPSKFHAMKVSGYSMIPMLLPDSWVLFESVYEFKGDGLYIINWRNELMVKLLQIAPTGRLHIISANKDYKSWEVDPDDQSTMIIIGRVIRSVI